MPRPNYKGLPTEFHRVRVQYGGVSKRERRVVRLGVVRVQHGPGEVVSSTYFRIASGERGAGQFFHVRRALKGADIKDQGMVGNHGYSNLPRLLREWLEHRADGETYFVVREDDPRLQEVPA